MALAMISEVPAAKALYQIMRTYPLHSVVVLFWPVHSQHSQ